jgi:Tol biopolymer transport system component
MIRRFAVLLLFVLAVACQATEPVAEPALIFDSPWPGRNPELIAPGVINTDGIEINLVFDNDYTELFFSRRTDNVFSIYTATLEADGWTAPEKVALFPEGSAVQAVDMALSPDGRSLYFLGITPGDDGPQRDIWVSDRSDTSWSTARRVPPPISSEHSEIYPVLTSDGSLWFVSDRPGSKGPRDLYRARPLAGGGFEPPVSLDPPINADWSKGDTTVAPDESYIVIGGTRDGGYGQGDLYVSFRNEDGSWTEPQNLGPTVNTADVEFCPMFSPDGRWFSFSRRYGDTWETTTDAEIYWMDTSILEELRPE